MTTTPLDVVSKSGEGLDRSALNPLVQAASGFWVLGQAGQLRFSSGLVQPTQRCLPEDKRAQAMSNLQNHCEHATEWGLAQ